MYLHNFICANICGVLTQAASKFQVKNKKLNISFVRVTRIFILIFPQVPDFKSFKLKRHGNNYMTTNHTVTHGP